MLDIKIGNMLRIEDADLQMNFGKITGITGMNAVGKTSIATLVGAILTGYDNPAGGNTKQKIYLKDDTDAGSATVQLNDEPVTSWNALTGEMSVYESAYQRPHSAAVGMIDFCSSMSVAQRTALWEQFFLPPKKALKKQIEKQLKPHLDEQLLKDIMETVEDSEIDVVQKTYAARAKNEKRDWMGVTGETWGSAKGADWLPPQWTSELDGKTQKMLKQQLQFEEEELRSLHVDQAVTRADIERAKESVAKAEELDKQIAELRLKARGLKPGLDEQKAGVDDLGERMRDCNSKRSQHQHNKPMKSKTMNCPDCGAVLLRTGDSLVSFDNDLFDTQVEVWEEEGKILLETGEKLTNQYEAIKQPYIDAQKEFDDIVNQGKELVRESDFLKSQAGLADAEPTEDNRKQIEACENKIEAIRDSIRLVEKREQAKQHHDNIIAYSLIAEIVGPKGVRAMSMQANMEKFDNILETIARVTGWPRVELDKTYAVSIDGRTFLKLCAETDRLRTQYTLQIALARFTRANAIILDGVDHLDDANMFTLAELLKAVCERDKPPAVMICGTELDLYQLNKDGFNYRIVNGKATLIK